jgi:N utilization substance protein B
MKGARRKAREMAFQVLYEIDTVNHRGDAVLERVATENKIAEDSIAFVRETVEGVLQNKIKIDGYIKKYARAFPIEQLSPVDKNILRLAIFEILLNNSTPVKVAIDEAVELAKTFGSEKSSRFVNGVLGSISSQPQME